MHTPARTSQCWSRQTPHGLGVCIWMHLINGTGNSPSPGQPTPGVVKQDKSSGGSVDTTKTRSGPQRVRMSSGERPIDTAKGKQSDPKALCQPPPPPPNTSTHPPNFAVSGRALCDARRRRRGRDATGQRQHLCAEGRRSHSRRKVVSPAARDKRRKQFAATNPNPSVHPDVPTGALPEPLGPRPPPRPPVSDPQTHAHREQPVCSRGGGTFRTLPPRAVRGTCPAVGSAAVRIGRPSQELLVRGVGRGGGGGAHSPPPPNPHTRGRIRMGYAWKQKFRANPFANYGRHGPRSWEQIFCSQHCPLASPPAPAPPEGSVVRTFVWGLLELPPQQRTPWLDKTLVWPDPTDTRTTIRCPVHPFDRQRFARTNAS